MASVTDLLNRWRAGDREAQEHLIDAVYGDLRRLARGQIRRERSDHTLEPTALAHEAYLRLSEQQRVEWQGRTHFFAVAALAMRRILVSHARKRAAGKRGGALRVTLPDELPADASEPDVLALDEALEQLEQLDPRQARVVELRFFGGLTVEETAAALGVSPATVKVDWSMARAWLYRKLKPG